MKASVYICILVVFGGVVIVSTIATPALLSDTNIFLASFIGSEFLGVLGVILAITLASSAQLHLAFNQIEEHYKASGGLAPTRASVRSDTYALIVLFLIAVVLVIAKAALATALPWAQSLFNGAALLVLLWNVLLLLSLTRTVFAIPPLIRDDEDDPN
jgi:hypothetical protein